jgi:hypothetical protein
VPTSYIIQPTTYIRAVHSLFLHPPWAFWYFVMICFHDNAKIEGKNHYVFYVNTGYSYSNNQLYTDLEEDIVHPILLRQFLKK